MEELAAQESMSVSALAVRELTAAVAFRRNADLVYAAPQLEVDLGDIVDAVRAGRNR